MAGVEPAKAWVGMSAAVEERERAGGSSQMVGVYLWFVNDLSIPDTHSQR